MICCLSVQQPAHKIHTIAKLNELACGHIANTSFY